MNFGISVIDCIGTKSPTNNWCISQQEAALHRVLYTPDYDARITAGQVIGEPRRGLHADLPTTPGLSSHSMIAINSRRTALSAVTLDYARNV